jgi:hypothetical protein
MFLCQWSLDIQFGKQKEALDIIKAWGEDKMKFSGFNKSKNGRVYVGYIGDSAAHIVDEYVFESLDDFEKALADMGKAEFQKHAQALASCIIPGTQKWNIFRIVLG